MIYEANASSSACRLRRLFQVETSTPPNQHQQDGSFERPRQAAQDRSLSPNAVGLALHRGVRSPRLRVPTGGSAVGPSRHRGGGRASGRRQIECNRNEPVVVLTAQLALRFSKNMMKYVSVIVGGLAAAAWPCVAAVDLSKLPPPAQQQGVTYAKDIRPIFEASCFRCHGAERPKAGLRLDSLETV